MSEHTEVMFTAQIVSKPNGWGWDITAQIVNPDGSVCVEHTVSCGPDGFTGAQYSDLAEFLGDEAKEYAVTAFDAAAEQERQYKEWI